MTNPKFIYKNDGWREITMVIPSTKGIPIEFRFIKTLTGGEMKTSIYMPIEFQCTIDDEYEDECIDLVLDIYNYIHTHSIDEKVNMDIKNDMILKLLDEAKSYTKDIGIIFDEAYATAFERFSNMCVAYFENFKKYSFNRRRKNR